MGASGSSGSNAVERGTWYSAESALERSRPEPESCQLAALFTNERQRMVLVSILEDEVSQLALRASAAAISTLGLEGPRLCRLAARCGAVRALLTLCLEPRHAALRTAALRALATISCVTDSIRELEKAGGVELLADLLTFKNPESERAEAAAVLAQITAPWVADNHRVNGLSAVLESMVDSLTELAGRTSSEETLLLSAAALANLTFLETGAAEILICKGSPAVLIEASKRPEASVFLQDQAATVLANLAATLPGKKYLMDTRSHVALLCLLQLRPSPLQKAAEANAAERVQQKAAIALSRLCADVQVAEQIVEMQGVDRLVRLCRDERERNHSDGVLVACLAALRKIAATCGMDVIKQRNATELVEPRLLDSFLIYSSRQESYV